jgi:hypothetical protein
MGPSMDRNLTPFTWFILSPWGPASTVPPRPGRIVMRRTVRHYLHRLQLWPCWRSSDESPKKSKSFCNLNLSNVDFCSGTITAEMTCWGAFHEALLRRTTSKLGIKEYHISGRTSTLTRTLIAIFLWNPLRRDFPTVRKVTELKTSNLDMSKNLPRWPIEYYPKCKFWRVSNLELHST